MKEDIDQSHHCPLFYVWVPAFLTGVQKSGNIARSAHFAGVSFQAVYRYRAINKEFRLEWDRRLTIYFSAERQRCQRSAEVRLSASISS